MTASTTTNASTTKPDPLGDVLEGLERLAEVQAQLIRQLIQRQQQP